MRVLTNSTLKDDSLPQGLKRHDCVNQIFMREMRAKILRQIFFLMRFKIKKCAVRVEPPDF